MFFEEGWVPLSEVTTEVFRRLQGMQAAGDVPDGQGEPLGPLLAVSVWDICDACTKVGVTASDGTVIPASKDLVAWADPRDLSNEHINLRDGTVGSSQLPNEAGKLQTLVELQVRYGPFLSMPVVIPINNFQSSLTFLEEEVKSQRVNDDAVRGAAKTIIQMNDAEGLLTRDIARRKLGSALSRRKFKLAWGLAARHRPTLALPSRWDGL